MSRNGVQAETDPEVVALGPVQDGWIKGDEALLEDGRLAVVDGIGENGRLELVVLNRDRITRSASMLRRVERRRVELTGHVVRRSSPSDPAHAPMATLLVEGQEIDVRSRVMASSIGTRVRITIEIID